MLCPLFRSFLSTLAVAAVSNFVLFYALIHLLNGAYVGMRSFYRPDHFFVTGHYVGDKKIVTALVHLN